MEFKTIIFKGMEYFNMTHEVAEWFIWLAIFYIPIGLIYQTILLYRLGVFLGFHGTRLYFKHIRKQDL